MSGAPVQEPSKKLHVALVAAPIDVAALHDEVADDGAGATLLFVDTVRNEKEARRVTHKAIAGEIAARWPVRRVALVHRVGRLEVGDASIAIVLSTPHRAEGFEALRFGIESVKKDVPIWKKEHFQDGAVWVQEGS
jgi:molybdopterin synthase catalytic subunit